MPFYVHPKDVELLEDYARTSHSYGYENSYPFFDTRKEAYAASEPGITTVSFSANYSELDTWSTRENHRARFGLYQRVPWSNREMPHYDDRGNINKLWTTINKHYVHMSLDRPGMIAYTASIEHGIADRQTRIAPGKYLREFWANYLTSEEILGYIHACSATGQVLHIARSVDDIRRIYGSKECGFSSCMQAKYSREYEWQKHYDNDSADHPCAMIYGNSDLGVAYVGDMDRVSQRAVVWPDKKQYVRIYGDGPLVTLLFQAGYREMGKLSGARIRRIDHPLGGFYMGYIDGSDYAYPIEDGYYTLNQSNGSTTRSVATDSLSGSTIDDLPDEDDEPESHYCDHCGDEPVDDSGDLCSSCADEQWECVSCARTYYGNTDQTELNGNYYCPRSGCAGTINSCSIESCDTRWIENDAFNAQERRTRTTRSINEMCPDCYALRTWCDTCEEHYLHDDTDHICPTCHRSPRCKMTGDLIASSPDDIVSPIDGSRWWALRDPAFMTGTVWVETADGGHYYTRRSSEYRIDPSQRAEFTRRSMDSAVGLSYIRIVDPRLPVLTQTIRHYNGDEIAF